MRAFQTDVTLEQHRLRRLLGGVLDDDAANLVQAEQAKGVSIFAPLDGDDVALFYTRYAITIQRVQTVLRGSGTPSVLFNIRHDPDRSAVGTAVVNAQTTTSVTTGDNVAIADATIPANSWVWLEITTVQGTVDEFHLTLFARVESNEGSGTTFMNAFSDAFDNDFD